MAGERRYRASRMAGLTELPAIIRDFSDQEAMEVALIENLQREDLNPIEEALGYQELMEQYGFNPGNPCQKAWENPDRQLQTPCGY